MPPAPWPGTDTVRLPARRWLVALGLLAAVNLAAGLRLSVRPDHAVDLQHVIAWSDTWLLGGDPYAPQDAEVDYPPWALVELSPLALLPEGARASIWIVLNVALLIALARRLARETREPPPVQLALVLLLVSTAAARTLTQFSVLSFTFAIAGALSASASGAAVLVGLALMKPQIGAVAWIWLLVSRQWGRAALALAVPVVLTMIFALRLSISPIALAEEYGRALTFVHGGPDALAGHTELRAWLLRLWPDQAGSLIVAAFVAVVLLIPAVVAAARLGEWTLDRRLEWLAFSGAASLLAVRHLSYDFLLLWPALVAWRVPPFAAAPRGRNRLVFLIFAAALVASVPGWVRLAVAAGAPATLLLLTGVDRGIAVAAYLALVRRIQI